MAWGYNYVQICADDKCVSLGQLVLVMEVAEDGGNTQALGHTRLEAL